MSLSTVSTNPRTRLTKAKVQAHDILILQARGWPMNRIAEYTGCTERTIFRALKRAREAPPLVMHGETTKAALLVGVPKQKLRDEQKQILMEKFHASTEQACNWIRGLIARGDARGFAMAMQGIEKMDRISGNSVGEGQKVEVTGLPTPQVDIKVLIAKILDKDPLSPGA